MQTSIRNSISAVQSTVPRLNYQILKALMHNHGLSHKFVLVIDSLFTHVVESARLRDDPPFYASQKQHFVQESSFYSEFSKTKIARPSSNETEKVG